MQDGPTVAAGDYFKNREGTGGLLRQSAEAPVDAGAGRQASAGKDRGGSQPQQPVFHHGVSDPFSFRAVEEGQC